MLACCLTENGQNELRQQCSRYVTPLELDVTKHESVQKCLQEVKQHLGDKGNAIHSVSKVESAISWWANSCPFYKMAATFVSKMCSCI